MFDSVSFLYMYKKYLMRTFKLVFGYKITNVLFNQKEAGVNIFLLKLSGKDIFHIKTIIIFYYIKSKLGHKRVI